MQSIRIMRMAAAILTLAAGVAWAADERAGTGGAPELRIPVGARSTAMAGADLASVMGAEALFYNPAGAAMSEHGTEVMLSHTEYFADMTVNYVGVVARLGSFGYLGVSAKVLSIGDIVRTSESAPDGSGDTFSPTFSTLGLSYARRMTDRVNFGGTVYYLSERVLQTTATGLAFDFGFQYDTGWRGVRLGMAMKNWGPSMNYDGSDFDRVIVLPGDDPQASGRNVRQGTATFELPSSFQMSAAVPVIPGDNPFMMYGAYNSNSFGSDAARVGGEFTVRRILTLRAGYHYNGDSDDLFDWGYGAGVVVPVGGSQLIVDYAGQPVNNGFFDDVHMVSLSFHF